MGDLRWQLRRDHWALLRYLRGLPGGSLNLPWEWENQSKEEFLKSFRRYLGPDKLAGPVDHGPDFPV